MTLRAAASIAWHSTPGRPAARRRGLGFVDDVEDLLLLVGGLAEDEGTRTCRTGSLRRCAAVVDEDDLALADNLRLERAVGQGGVLADLAAGVAGEADAIVGGRRRAR